MDWTAIIVAFLGSAAAIGTVINEFRKQNKKRLQIDETQTKEINEIKISISEIKQNSTNINNEEIKIFLNEIKTQISELNEMHKYSRFEKILKNQIEDVTERILAQKKEDKKNNFNSDEIERALRNGRDKSFIIFNYILNKDFNVDLKLVSKKIIDNLNLWKPNIP